jgi:hypothetical protein
MRCTGPGEQKTHGATTSLARSGEVSMAKGLAGLGRYLTVNGCCPHHGTRNNGNQVC